MVLNGLCQEEGNKLTLTPENSFGVVLVMMVMVMMIIVMVPGGLSKGLGSVVYLTKTKIFLLPES